MGILPNDYPRAIELLTQGGVVAVPTETVYGLAADATNSAAVMGIFRAKQRPAENPLIVHVASMELVEQFASIEQAWVYDCIDAFCPGPLSLVLPYRGGLAEQVTAGLNTVAVRFPDHPTLARILKDSRLALAAPSANRSGSPSATTWQAVLEDLEGKIDGVVCDEPCRWGLESTVIDATTDTPILLRAGAISLEALQAVAPKTTLPTQESGLHRRSPGTRFRHYQPRARVILVDSIRQALPQYDSKVCAVISLESLETLGQFACSAGLIESCSSMEDYAQKLYDFFRRADALHCEVILCQSVPEQGLGRALMDRLRRACE